MHASSLAAKVFASPQPEPARDTRTALVSGEEAPKGGRILPSLFPASPFEASKASIEIKPPRIRRARAVPELEAREFKPAHEERPVLQAEPLTPDDGTEQVSVGAEPLATVAAAPVGRSGRKPYGLRAAGRVRAGEQWKRRRLPKALW